jgi:PKD repeat protein
MIVAGVVQDFGTLSARSIVTDSSGVAAAVYTAPPAPPPSSGGTATVVGIRATPSGSNAAASTASRQAVEVRLVPPGVLLPPAGTPTASFTVSPSPVNLNVASVFDASASSAGSASNTITSYAWSFGDGTSGAGRTVSHAFSSVGTFTVTLTVTNDRGLSASTSQPLAVGSVASPTARIVLSPTTPLVGQSVNFNGDTSTAATGHLLTAFGWNFGDGATGSGSVVSHTFTASGTFTVVLTVSDDTGQKSTATQAVPVSNGSGAGAAPTADFVFSPAAPQVSQTVFFDATAAKASAGHSITSYAWNFGDGLSSTTVTATTSHSYSSAATNNVVLTVTDDTGLTNSATHQVTVSAGAGSLTAGFTMSPTNPVSGTLVSFNANTSSPLGTITAFDWDFGDGTIINGTAGLAGCQATCGMVINHSYNTPVNATYTIRLTVHDSSGRTATATNTLAVTSGADPLAQFTISPNPATVGAIVTFDGSASTAGAGAITSYQWNFGDGSLIASGNPVNHSYAAKGTYTITLTVTQTNGKTNSTTHTLLVQ